MGATMARAHNTNAHAKAATLTRTPGTPLPSDNWYRAIHGSTNLSLNAAWRNAIPMPDNNPTTAARQSRVSAPTSGPADIGPMNALT